MAYTDATKVSNFLQRALNSYETAELDTVIAAVKQWLDKRLGSTFDQVSPSTRTYDGGVRSLDIDPCTNVTKVEAISDDGSDNYAYSQPYEIVLEPQNETIKREIRRRLGHFPSGIARVAVTATFSEYDTDNGGVPADIQMVATRLAVGVLNSGKFAGGDNLQKESLEGHMVQYDTSADALEGIAASDPTVASVLASREELLIDTVPTPRDRSGYEEDGEIYV